MSLFLVLFFISAMGLSILIGRKMYVLRHTEVHVPKDLDFTIDVPDFEDVKHVFITKSRRYGYVALVITIRLYVIGTHAAKQNIRKLTQLIKDRVHKRQIKPKAQKPENKFLKRITEYKNKIERIKDRIKTEEGLN